MGLSATVFWLLALQPQVQAPAGKASRPLPLLHAEVCLAPSSDPVPLAEFGLGAGGVERNKAGQLRWLEHGDCVTAGGVRVDCRSAGVKLTFPSGRELLVAPDGVLHLRSCEHAGPFPFGLELRLGDGTCVRITLAQSERERLRDVLVVDGEHALQPWRRGGAAMRDERPGHWAGLRFFCCGDGGDVYRAVAIGPLLVLDRVLVPETRVEATPRQRLVVATAPILESLDVMRRQHREADAAVRKAITAVGAVADRGSDIFPAGAVLQRSEKDRLRWLLGCGFELQLDLDGPRSPRLSLFVGENGLPMVEWILSGDPAAFLTNPRDDQIGKRWHGNGTRLSRVLMDLQAREELFERGYALRVIERLRK
ncbi:MAG TPA: hypothetical protein VFD82_14160 [Planctomycetota bacterium]|nr:hypothetical protein [Planctomycetota bacterium]